MAIGVATSLSGFAAPTPENTPDYFVEWVQPSAALYVDTGVTGKCGVKAELKYLYVQNGTYPVMLGSWGGDNKRFNLVMHQNEEARWEYGNEMVNLGAFAHYGEAMDVSVEVTAAGTVSFAWTNTNGQTTNSTMDVTGTYGVLNADMPTFYLFASHWKSNSVERAEQPHLGRLYSCKLWTDYEGTGTWTPARNLRPCVKDGVAGLYDSENEEILYPEGNPLVAGPVAYDTIATWNGGAAPAAADLATAANWICTDANGTSVASAVPDKATLVVFPGGIGSVTLPSDYAATWGAVRAEGSVAHPATMYGKTGNNRSNIAAIPGRYTLLGAGSLGDLVKVKGAQSAANYYRLQMRHDGWFYVDSAQAGTWTFNQDVDDYFALFIDGEQVLFNHTYNPGVSGVTCTVAEGWHRFTHILADTGGGWGVEYKFGNDYVPFTITVNDSTYLLSDDTTFPKGSGTSTITLADDADWSAFGTVSLASGVVLDLNGHNLTLCDIVADDYLGTVITNSAARKSVLFFTGEPLESRVYTEGVVKEAGTKVVLAKVGEQAAFWTGAAGDGSVANAGNWEDVLTGEGVVPTADYDVTISGTAVNLQVPANVSLAYKSLTILSCTLAANCDWTGLGTITLEPGSTIDLNGHDLKVELLTSAASASVVNSGAAGAAVWAANKNGENNIVAAPVTVANTVTLRSVAEGSFSPSNFAMGANRTTPTQFVVGDGDVVSATGWGTIARVANTSTVMDQTGGSFATTAEFTIGESGTGVYNLSDGTARVGGKFYVGRSATAAVGTVNMTGGNLTVVNEMQIGLLGTGVFNQSGGTLTVNDNLQIGQVVNNSGPGNGTFNLSGNGTVECKAYLAVGRAGAGTGTFNITGGNYTSTQRLGIVGEAANGVLDVSDTGVANFPYGLEVARGGNGTVYLRTGGTINTAFVQKMSGAGKPLFYAKGGTLAATGDNAKFIGDIGDFLFSGGTATTIDTAGHGVSVVNCGYNAAYGASLVKTGMGTLTFDALPPVGSITVSAGTVALSAAGDNSKVAAALAHRWSFNGANEAANLTDSVGGVKGSKIGTAVAFADGQVAFTGNGNGKGSLNLGKGILGIGDATIEIWATRTAIKNWGRVFDYGASTANWITMAWNIQSDNNRCKVAMCKGGGQDYKEYSGFSFGSSGNESYFVVRLHAKADDGKLFLDWREYDSATQALLHSGSITNSRGLTLEYLYNDKATFYIGHALYSADYDAHAKYNDVRIWKGALSDDAIALSVAKGPDATSADIAEIVAANDVSATRTLELASGATLSIASGQTLTQPVVKGSGTIAGGTLVVSDKIVATVGECIEASGTIDLSNAKIELVDPENLASPFTFLKPTTGQTLTVTGVPTPTNLPKQWKVSVSANGTGRIVKRGFMIIVK